MKKIQLLLYFMADISVLYFLLLLLKLGFASLFSYFFLALSLVLFGVARMLEPERYGAISPKIRISMIIVVSILLMGFMIIEGLIVAGGCTKTKEDADYVVVLGCRVRGTTPSLSLRYRLDAAYDYLIQHPDADVVVTGGKGLGEDIPEAQAMAQVLVEKGIDESRIHQEEQSTTTKENLEFSKQYINPEKDRIVVVSTNYHMFRAMKIAHAAGYAYVDGYAAQNVWYLVPADYIREALAIVKNFVLGNMR